MGLPVISLVTPVLNGEKYLEAALTSIHCQAYPALEHVVADGGSTDGTLDILRRHGAKLASYFSKKDEGLYDALNKGFARTNGEVMGYLNADDLLTPWALSVVGEIFATFPNVDWLTTRHPIAWDRMGRAVRISHHPGFTARGFFAGANLADPKQPGTFWIQQESTFWRRSLWNKTGGGFDASLRQAGDFDLWARFFKQTDLYAVDTPLGGFRRHVGQLTGDGGKVYRDEATACLRKHGGHVPNRLRWEFHSLARRLGLSSFGSYPVIRFDWRTGAWQIERRWRG